MFLIRSCACGAILLVGAAGCAPMPRIEPAEQSVSRLTGIDDAFVFRTEAEAVDMPSTVGPRLALADMLKLAIRHDPRIQSAVARVRQAEADAHQARLLPNPVLDITVRFPEAGGTSIVDVGLAADLLTLLRKPGQVSVADHRLRAASAEMLVVVLDVVAECRRQYAEAQWLDLRVAVEAERDGVLKQLGGIAKSQFDAGEVSQTDVLAVEAEYTAIASELRELETDRRDARLVLARMIGAPTGAADWILEEWKMPETGSYPASTQPAEASIQRELAEMALERRPEILAHQWRLAALGDEAKQAGTSIFDGAEVGVAAEREGEWSVGPAIAVPLPVFDWGQARQANAEAQKIEARHELTQARRLVVQEVRRAVNRLESARQTLAEVKTKLVPLQVRRLDQARDAYAAGGSDITAVRNAERDLQSARTRQAELQYKLTSAAIDLERAVGGGGAFVSPGASGSPTHDLSAPVIPASVSPTTAPSPH